MADRIKSGGAIFIIDCVTLALTIIGVIFFILSYQTGYIGIIYGEKNSIWITVELVAVIVVCVYMIISQVTGKVQKTDRLNLLNYILIILLTTAILFLLVDRVDAIGNCIVAPWDAGHGGEDSCYLSFVSIGCWLVCLITDIVISFVGYEKKINGRGVK